MRGESGERKRNLRGKFFREREDRDKKAERKRET